MKCGEYTVTLQAASATIPLPERKRFLQAFDRIAAENWHLKPDFWASQPTVLDGDRGLVTVTHQGEIVGCSIYERLIIDGARVLYRFATDIAPAAQGQGLYNAINAAILATEHQRTDAGLLYYSWRTRNPIVWAANARFCQSVVPPILGDETNPALLALACRVAAALYPGVPLEMPSMVMRGVYTEFSLKRTPRHPDPRIDGAFFGNPALADPTNALFSVGLLW